MSTNQYEIICPDCGEARGFMEEFCPVCGTNQQIGEFERALAEFEMNGMHIEKFAATFAEV